jgi:hypothetical protein
VVTLMVGGPGMMLCPDSRGGFSCAVHGVHPDSWSPRAEEPTHATSCPGDMSCHPGHSPCLNGRPVPSGEHNAVFCSLIGGPMLFNLSTLKIVYPSW